MILIEEGTLDCPALLTHWSPKPLTLAAKSGISRLAVPVAKAVKRAVVIESY